MHSLLSKVVWDTGTTLPRSLCRNQGWEQQAAGAPRMLPPTSNPSRASLFPGQALIDFSVPIGRPGCPDTVTPPYYIYVLRAPIFDIFLRKILIYFLTILLPLLSELFDNALHPLPAGTFGHTKFSRGVPVCLTLPKNALYKQKLLFSQEFGAVGEGRINIAVAIIFRSKRCCFIY